MRDAFNSVYFSRGNIFVKVVILAISWKKFRGRAVCVKTTPILGARTLYARGPRGFIRYVSSLPGGREEGGLFAQR